MGIIDSESRIFISVSTKPGNLGATVYRNLFSRHSINAVYIPRIAPKSAKDLSSAIRTLNISGCSVSMPLKSDMTKYLDVSNEIVEKTHSVNTIVCHSGVLRGFNTDYEGMLDLIKKYDFTSALIYGNGGVVGSVVEALKYSGVEDITLCSRSVKNGLKASKFHKVNYATVESVEGSIAKKTIFINATPVGWIDKDISHLKGIIKKTGIIFDLAPSRSDTEVVKFSKEHKKIVISGIDLFKSQVRFQFNYYTGIMPSPEDVSLALDI